VSLLENFEFPDRVLDASSLSYMDIYHENPKFQNIYAFSGTVAAMSWAFPRVKTIELPI